MQNLKKIIKSIQIYLRYFHCALIEIYLYYTSPWPIHMLLKKWALANRATRVLWAPPSPGRKPLDQEIINLILEMKKLNPRWGGQRISDELAKIGYKACSDTVLKYLETYGLHDPSSRRGSSWKKFIDNYKFKIAIDFTSLISLMGYQLFIFVMVNLDTRKLLLINVTYSPNFDWMAQQFKNAFFDLDDYPSLCICDRDQIFEGRFERMLRNYYRIKLRRTPYQAPSKNGRVERFHLSLKSKAFRNVVPVNLEQAQRVCTEYKKYYNHHRPHQGIAGKIPGNSNQKQTKRTKFILHKHLGRKITSFDPNLLSAA